MRRFLNRRTIALTLISGATLAFFMLILCDRKIKTAAAGKTYSEVAAIPANRVGLVLGTGKNLGNGTPNPYFSLRMEAAAALYSSGKIQYLIVSGDNSKANYNEPADMQAALIAKGVDSSHIYLDYAGFRTFDSMIRARDIFGQTNLTVISQHFHNERAIYLAQNLGMQAIGFDAGKVSGELGLKTDFREKFARVNAWLDLQIGTKPKFSGSPIVIGG